MLNKPHRGRLIEKVVFFVGKHGGLLEKDLIKEIAQSYSNTPESVVISAIEDIVLELDEKGLLQVQNGNRITLTKLGLAEYKSICAGKELKQRRRARKLTARRKQRESLQKNASSRSIHEKLKLEIGELAYLLGSTWAQEYELVKGGPVILDLVWYGRQRRISHAFEVQHRGEWKNALGNLEAMRRYHPSCKLFLVVYNEKELRPIQQLLGTQLNKEVKVLKVSDIRD